MKLEDADVPSLLFTEQGSAPTTPATGKWRPFFKSDGLYHVDDAGAVVGPLGTGAIRVEDEGSSTVAAATGINFAGAGVTVTDAGSNEALVTIPGGGGVAAGEVGGPPLLRLKTADESVTSSATLQDDNHLTIPVGATEVWLLDFTLFVTGVAAGDVAFGLAGPASTTAVFGGFGLIRAATTNEGGVRTNGAGSIAGSVSFGLVTGETNVISMSAYVSTTASGNVVLQWAQRVSDGTATTLVIGSQLKAYRYS